MTTLEYDISSTSPVNTQLADFLIGCFDGNNVQSLTHINENICTQRVQTLPMLLHCWWHHSGKTCRPYGANNTFAAVHRGTLTHFELQAHTLGAKKEPKGLLKVKTNPVSTCRPRSTATVTQFWRDHPLPRLPCLVDISFRVCKLSCSQKDRQTDRTNDHITPPTLAQTLASVNIRTMLLH